MAYNGNLTWTDIAANIGYYGLRAKDAILAGHEQYLEWLIFRDGRDNPTIAAALSVSEEAIIDAEYAFSALEELYMVATGGAVIQANRLDSLRKFT